MALAETGSHGCAVANGRGATYEPELMSREHHWGGLKYTESTQKRNSIGVICLELRVWFVHPLQIGSFGILFFGNLGDLLAI